MKRLAKEFYTRDVLTIAPELPGKKLLFRMGNEISSFTLTDVEAYRGFEDKACHASKGKTKRTEVMFNEGGIIYMYLIYGIYWMLNIVTGPENIPQAVLIRGLKEVSGPGRLTKFLGINGSFNGESLLDSNRIWLEEGVMPPVIESAPRIGIDYAGEPWVSKKWRFFIP